MGAIEPSSLHARSAMAKEVQADKAAFELKSTRKELERTLEAQRKAEALMTAAEAKATSAEVRRERASSPWCRLASGGGAVTFP